MQNSTSQVPKRAGMPWDMMKVNVIPLVILGEKYQKERIFPCSVKERFLSAVFAKICTIKTNFV